MKIVLCSHNYYPARGGAELVWKNVAERLVRRGHDVRVVATNARSTEDYFVAGKGRDLFPAGTETIEGVPVTRVPFRRLGARWLNFLRSVSWRYPIPGRGKWRAISWGPRGRAYGRAVESISRDMDADLIAAGPFPTLVVDHARRAAARLRKPLVIVPCYHTEDTYSFDNPLYYDWMREAAGLVCFTDLEREHLAAKAGMPRDKFRTAGIGLDIDATFLPDGEIEAARAAARESVRTRLGLTQPNLVLFFGQQVPHKGIIPLIDAMEIVWSDEERAAGRSGGAELVIAGNPSSHTPAIMNRIAALPERFRSRVRVSGHVSETERTELFRAADVFVTVSPFESCGIGYLVAWREGTPVVACSRGASSRLVEAFRDGLLVRDGDAFELSGAIAALLDDPDLRRRMGMRGRAKVRERFDWEHVAGRYEEFFASIASTAGGASPSS
jgi:glycosyltransferase involved in cell wall biosynthesis